MEHVTGLRVLKELPGDLHHTETLVVLGKSAKKGIWSNLTAKRCLILLSADVA